MKYALLAAFLLIGCQSLQVDDAFTFTPYQGEQKQWRTTTGGFPLTVDGVEIYKSGWPLRQYQVLGEMTGLIDLHKKEETPGATVARFVHKFGGDGAILSFSELRHDYYIMLRYFVIRFTPNQNTHP